jgi:CRISPR-associated protein Cmr1
MRKVPDHRAAPVAPVVREHPTRVVWERTYRFITPVFGGGVKVEDHRKPYDRVTPVRASAIRGQLRFWWRAVNPRRCTTPDELAKAEARVFGRAANEKKTPTAALAITVTKQPVQYSELRPLRDGDKFGSAEGFDAIAYGAFPLRDSKATLRHGVLHQYSDDWTIELSMESGVETDMEAALWAWTQFGGLGGRTRRGFGAIELRSSEKGAALMDAAAGWSRWKLAEAPKVGWPHLRGRVQDHLSDAPGVASGLAAQKKLLDELKKLRQGVNHGRNPGQEPNRPGRSRWPEADAIRRWAEKHDPTHVPISAVPRDAFPRGVFGTPIIFQFKGKGPGRHNEPMDSTLNPEGKRRLASPLILRPTFEGGVYLPRAVRLRGTIPEHFELKGDANATRLRVTLTPTEIAQVSPLGKDPDPITRYLNILRNGR